LYPVNDEMYSCLHDINNPTNELRLNVEIGLEFRKTSCSAALAAQGKHAMIDARQLINDLYMKKQ
jgi:hypothetical protein